MASFGRLAISGITGSSENTVALANFNVDFSLLKIVPPQEFMDVGNCLSAFRRQNAEEGHIHQTARKLGAIFEPILPSTPLLLKSYGIRASEIAQMTAVSTPQAQGMFAKQSGIDAASIWAAATSGSGALQVHLLACMLARIWEQKDAISIWEEILQSRKLEIQESFQNEGTLNMAACTSYLASLQTITRTHIGEWDNSARSWLRVADRSPNVLVRQNQLDQIVGKSKDAVESRPSLYSNVIETWKVALEGTERLLKGSPQKMQTGGLLLGLNAWHLYPDINILGDPNMFSEFGDSLIPKSGILTVGMVGNALLSEGLHWSLPLAHLRYYGDPVTRIGRLRGVRKRISLSEFMQSVLGCLLGVWKIHDSMAERVLKWIVMLKNTIARDSIDNVDSFSSNAFRNTWLALLAEAVREFLESEGDNRSLNKRLVNAGRLYGSKSFLGTHPTSFLGLSRTEYYFRALKHQESKIRFLRELLKDAIDWKDDVFIRYTSVRTGREEFASVFPHAQTSKRKADGTSQIRSCHVRWIHSHPPEFSKEDDVADRDILSDVFWSAPDTSHSDYNADASSKYPIRKDASTLAKEEFEKQRIFYEGCGEIVYSVEDESVVTLEKGNDMRVIWGGLSSKKQAGVDKWYMDHYYGEVKHFAPCFGDFHNVALFLRMGERDPKIPVTVKFETLEALFLEDDQLVNDFPLIFIDGVCSLGADCVVSLKAIATIHKIYASLPSATIAIKLLEIDSPLSRACWVQRESERFRKLLDQHKPDGGNDSDNQSLVSDRDEDLAELDLFQEASFSIPLAWRDENKPLRRKSPQLGRFGGGAAFCIDPYDLQLAEMFSCILLCESGTFNIPSSHLIDTMAISSGDSMYIAAQLLTDPAKAQSNPHDVRHVMGNIGRPGTALLQAPVDPKIRSVGIEQWTYISAEDWDGYHRDSFKDTSLHLWFTGSSVPIYGKHVSLGEKDTELYLLESVVSVHGRGLEGPSEWVADLDILRALRDPSLTVDDPFRTPSRKTLPSLAGESNDNTCCKLSGEKHHKVTTYDKEALKLTAVESWIELLQTQEENTIFLAKGNWQARQAATAISIAKGRKTCVLRDDTCWPCIAKQCEEWTLQSGMPTTFIA